VLKKLSILFITIFSLLSYMLWIEPQWIQVTHHQIEGNLRSPLKIAHITDLHLHKVGSYEEKILDILEKERPDTVCVTGDSIDSKEGYKFLEVFFTKLRAPLGVFVVRGNWENWVPLENEKEFYKKTGVTFLLNESKKIREDVEITGWNDLVANEPFKLEKKQKNVFRIGLFHSPEYFKQASCDLCLAGHTHGGQIRLPFLPPFWLPKGSGEYISGWYEQIVSKMYVSWGLGTSILPMRFFARPELPIFSIRPKIASPSARNDELPS